MGSGKSTVAALLRERGAHLIDADAIARDIVQPGSAALLEICLLYTSPSPRDRTRSRMPSSA